MISHRQKAFTLAEVLIVLGIIALLAGLILIGTKNIREKARIAKGLNFSAQIHHALGSEAVGVWDFNTGYGIKVIDSSGYGNDGTLGDGNCQPGQGFCPQWVKDTPSQTGYGLSFISSNNYVAVESSSSLEFDDKITISVWVKFNSVLDEQTIVHGTITGGLGESYWLRQNGGTKIKFRVNEPAGQYLEAGVSLVNNVWYHLVATYNGSTAKIYLDGKEIKSEQKEETIAYENGLKIGNSTGVARNLNGSIDDLRIYKEGFSSTQVKKIYVEEAKKRGLLE